MYTNANCLRNKYGELRGKLDTMKPDLVGITEVWDKENFVVQGYHPPLRKDRVNRAGGGVMLLVRDNLEVTECKELNDSDFQESVWCIVKTPQSTKILVGVCYRSPSSLHENNMLLCQLMKAAKLKSGLTLIMGDFNYDQINWEHGSVEGPEGSDAVSFFNATQDMFLCQHVGEPTRYRNGQTPSRLDLVFTSEEHMIDEVISSSPLGKSDHTVLTWALYADVKCLNGASERKVCSNARLNFKKGDYEGMRARLADKDWSSLKDLDVEAMWKQLKDTIAMVIHEFVPEVRLHRKSKLSAPWWTSELSRQVKRKTRAWNTYTSCRSEANYKKYTQERNKSTAMIRKTRQEYENKLIEDIPKQPKKLFQYVRRQQKAKPMISSLESEGRNTETDTESAEALQKYFMSVFVEEGLGHLPDFQDQLEENENEHITDIELSHGVIHHELESLQEDKAAGPDDIPSIVLKHCAFELTIPLFYLFNASLTTGKLPQDWKNAKITPIYKKGSRNKPENYRPVSLTSQVCKVLERIVKKGITAHLSSNNLLSKQQHGFTQKRSCMTNLLETLEDWTSEVDQGNSVDCVFLDFRKAFDSVPHRRLVKKLQSYGIRGNLLAWIQDFLSNRWQKVVIRNGESAWGHVTSGVPQGSVLGPTLFLLFVNELPSLVEGRIKMFADDCKLYRPIGDTTDGQSLQQDLFELEKWTDQWLLKFNSSKCKVMHIATKNPHIDYQMRGDNGQYSSLKETMDEKDLGINVANTLKPTTHCQKAASKVMSALRLLRLSFDHLNIRNFKSLYTTYVRPHLEYGIQAVGPYMAQDFKALEQVQRRATKLVSQIRNLSYEERLKKLKILSIKDRVIRGDLIETHKILTGKVDTDAAHFFELSREERTRGHQLKLKKKRAVHLARIKFFSHRVVSPWNRLPEEVVTAQSTNGFKNGLDQHWATVTYA